MYDWASVSSFDLYGLSWQGCILTIICCLMWEWQFLGLKILLKCQENILNFINCKGSSFQNILYQRAVYHLHIRWNSRRGFFYNITKVEIAKDLEFANVKGFWHLMWKTFCYSGGPIQSKPIYRLVTYILASP